MASEEALQKQAQEREKSNYHLHCWKKTTDNNGSCTFCGAHIENGDKFCPECGSPREGIICPQCGTLNFRSFCSKCNAPLNDNANAAIAQAQSDPHYQKCLQLNKELAKMADYIASFENEVRQAMQETGEALSQEGESLMDKYEQMLKLMGQKTQAKPQMPEQKHEQRKLQLRSKYPDIKEVMEAYKAKSAEMQESLSSMFPDAGITPELQRDFVSARKIPVKTKVLQKQPTYWVCNYCGCPHNQPSECAEPWHGGVWQYETIEIEETIFKYPEE